MKARSLLQVVTGSAAVFAIVVLPGSLSSIPGANADPATGAPAVRDGKTEATAAASCWQIKQDDADAADGAYWLQTPAMKAPEQFFCDQTTDGGGWVLVGRGREGWENWPEGKGSRESLITRDRSTASFDAAQLSNETVDALLNSQSPGDLPEGYRVLRAADASASTYQTVDIKPQNMPHWRWMFRSMMPLHYRFDGGSWHDAVATRGFGRGNGVTRVDMRSLRSAHYNVGFAYGKDASISGTGDKNAFVHRSGDLVLPYSEVYVRPRIENNDPGFAQIADTGADATTRGPVVSSFARATSWGVDGNLNGSVREGDIQVQRFVQVGDLMYVGGNFTDVVSSSGERYTSRGLAVFNAETGEFVPHLTFDFDNQVHDMVSLPSGRLLVVGDFRTVNGQTHVGTVLIDPHSGAIDQSWSLQVVNLRRNGVTTVRAAAIDGSRVYLAGNFTHLKADENSRRIRTKNAGRTDLSGQPDRSWNPEINGTVRDIAVDEGTDQFLAGGFFARSRGTWVGTAVSLSLEAGAAVNSNFRFVGSDSRRWSKNYQQTVDIAGDRVYFGGSEHNLFGYDKATMERRSGTIAQVLGGDLQAITHAPNGVLYASCHCSDFAYENSFTWPNVGTEFTDLTTMRWVGALDAATGKQHDWTPYRLASRRYTGAWALTVTEAGTLWAGGDFTSSYTSTSRRQWNGGFALYPATDVTPPQTPTGLSTTAVDNKTATLTWSAASDAVAYEILRDDRTIATTTETTFTVDLGGANRYFVRAVDTAGNRSATTAVLAVTPGSQSEEDPHGRPNPEGGPNGNDSWPDKNGIFYGQVFGENTDWAYRWAAEAPDPSWASIDFDDSSWPRGTAPIGYGHSLIQTAIDPGEVGTRPVTTYFRKSFDIAEDEIDRLLGANVYAAADDGAVVYLNGEEIGRIAMMKGRINHWTRADRSLGTAAADAEYKKYEPIFVPKDKLRVGKNVVAIETHVGYKASRSMSAWGSLDVVGHQN